MKYALVNPNWTFEGSTYFGCREPHFPVELLSAQAMLRSAGHDVLLIDAFMEGLTARQAAVRLDAFGENFLVVPTAPSYLFWRCPQPELRVARHWIAALRRKSPVVVIGPHGSVTPRATMAKTGADVVLRGEPDQTLPELASVPWEMIHGCCWRDPGTGAFRCAAGLGAVDMRAIPELDYSDYPVERHSHLHHVFPGNGADHLKLGAEVEFARGCPYACTFCNKTLFRNKYRERALPVVLAEIDQLLARGVDYIYFIDEIFGVGKQVRELLEELAARPVSIGFQTRIDLWDEQSIDLLARAHCVSFECGIESITDEGRDAMNKNCRISTERITESLIGARRRIPWVQANLIKVLEDDAQQVAAWQANLKANGVWVSEPVPMFPFPGSPEYVTTFGSQPDEQAWERAHAYYLRLFSGKGWSDIQERVPLPLARLDQQENGEENHQKQEKLMRVLLTTDTIGGVWTFTRELTGQLLTRGHAVALVSFGRAPSQAQLHWCGLMAAAYPRSFLYEPSDVPLEWMQENQVAFGGGATVIANVAARFRPDVLHGNQFCWGALRLGVPAVITAHSDLMSWAAAVRPEILQGSEWLEHYRALVQAGLDSADAFTAPTVWMREALRSSFRVPSRFEVIYNGLTIRRAISDPGRELRAVSAGRLWDEAKGLRTLLEIDPAMPVVIAGEGSFEDADVSSRRAISRLGLLDEEQLLRTFASSAVYIAASVYEPFGLAPLEAALCGCAVVARDLKSLREVWSDGALYFHSSRELESLLLKLATDRTRLWQAQIASIRRARLFTAERMVSSYLGLYGSLLREEPVHPSGEEITAHAAQAKTRISGAYAALGLE